MKSERCLCCAKKFHLELISRHESWSSIYLIIFQKCFLCLVVCGPRLSPNLLQPEHSTYGNTPRMGGPQASNYLQLQLDLESPGFAAFARAHTKLGSYPVRYRLSSLGIYYFPSCLKGEKTCITSFSSAL